MITHSGVHIQKIGGIAGTPTAMDIAVHSGRICRYGGAVWWTLLPHLVFVGLMAFKRSGSVANLLWGFLHDAHEVVTSDVPRPFKCDCMRKEQKAIDKRIYNNFWRAGGRPGIIDYELIKQCDIDALHIEAVELRLPGFAEVELTYAADYMNETKIYDDAEDKSLFQKILYSPFGDLSTIIGEDSVAVSRFAGALSLAKVGDYDCFLKRVEGWGLL